MRLPFNILIFLRTFHNIILRTICLLLRQIHNFLKVINLTQLSKIIASMRFAKSGRFHLPRYLLLTLFSDLILQFQSIFHFNTYFAISSANRPFRLCFEVNGRLLRDSHFQRAPSISHSIQPRQTCLLLTILTVHASSNLMFSELLLVGALYFAWGQNSPR